jgi:glycosyltransferase involved in cell wall biosynthesis
MRVLVWQWGRRGAGPRIAAELVRGLARAPGVTAALSLSAGAELLAGPNPPPCDLPEPTYAGAISLALRLPRLPFQVAGLARRVAALRPDLAICAMPAPLDLLMAASLRRTRTPYAVVVHDADLHPGDRHAWQMILQRRLVAGAAATVALSRHVGDRLVAQCLVPPARLVLAEHPPLAYAPAAPPPRAHGGPLRLLFFGRLLPYKGLDLLADTIAALGPANIELRVAGEGDNTPELARLAGLPGTTVENRWVPEGEIGALLAWADALVLPYREASQSGVAATALAAGRYVIATNVGGIPEQLRAAPLARLVPPDAAALAAAIRTLAEAPPPAAPAAAADRWPEMAGGMLDNILRITGT